jgi:uncharacterized membrane protein
MPRILLAGESWMTTAVHTKGFDAFTTVDYHEGADALLAALRDTGHAVTFMPNHLAARDFPGDRRELDRWDVVLLSDIGANTLLVPPETFAEGKRAPNRLRVLAEWTQAGGGLGMIGGYLSFQGIEAKANYRNTPLADILPVEMEPGDDREETPEGVAPKVVAHNPVTDGVDPEWPHLLGYQRAEARPSGETLVTVGGRPLLVLGTSGRGRTAAYMSDIGPHWSPEKFTSWPGFGTVWDRVVRWLAGEELERGGDDLVGERAVPERR